MNTLPQFIVYQGGNGEIIEKKSRFLAEVVPVHTEEEALAFLAQKKKTYWDASHNCYAYILSGTTPIERASDDGEPSKTAGRPMLEVLQGAGLTDCLAVVTRYFGGTLLGTGGLVRAYQLAVKEALSNCILAKLVSCTVFRITTDYNGLGKLKYIAEQLHVSLDEVTYTDQVTVTVFLTADTEADFLFRVREQTAGRARIETLGSKVLAVPEPKL